MKLKFIANFLILVSFLFSIYSCNQENKEKIIVTKTLICNSYAYGYVGSGSCLFDYKDAKQGYLVQLKSGEEVIRSYYCLPDELNFNIEKMRYEHNSKDSIIDLK